MTRSPVRRSLFFFSCMVAFPVLVMGCPKKQPPVVDAGVPASTSSPDVTELAPLTEDAGEDADAEAGRKWSGGGGGGPNAKVLACCAAMRAQAKKLGASSPEGFQIQALASQCEVAAKGNAPEFAQLFAIIRSKNVPGCQGL